MALENSKRHWAGVGSHFDATDIWHCFSRSFPTQDEDEQSLPLCALNRDAARVLVSTASNHSKASSHSKASADQLRDFLDAGLCKKAQLHTWQETPFGLSWSERQESLAAFGEPLKSTSLALQTLFTFENLLGVFRAGLLLRSQDQAKGHFHTVLSTLLGLSSV